MLRPPSTLATLPAAIHGARDYGELTRLGLNPAKVIDFSANSNPYGPHPAVLEAVAAAVTIDTLARYPDRDCLALRAAIAAAEKASMDTLLPGNGTVELIQLIALAFVRPGSRHLILAPTFGEYARAIHLLGGQVYEYRPPAASADLRLDAEGVTAAIRRLQPDSIWLCNPNNPTGQQWTASELAYLRAADPAQRMLWVVDESYRYFTADPIPLATWSEGENIIILRSLTKDQALAGLRLGYAMAAPPLIAVLRALQPTWSVNSLAQVAGVAALQAPVLVWRQHSLARLRQHAADLWVGLAELDFEVLPTTTSFTLVRVENATNFRHRLLLQGLQVRDCASFGLPRHIRIAAHRPAENESLLNAFKLGSTQISGVKSPLNPPEGGKAPENSPLWGTRGAKFPPICVDPQITKGNRKTMLEQTIHAITPLDEKSMAAARERQATLTKPADSLGRLETLSIQIAGITGRLDPPLTERVIIVAAGDHGVTAEGVSAFPAAVTPQMVLNFLHGGAAINVLARQAGARVVVLDAGVAADLPRHPDLVDRKIALGTANLTHGPAMTRTQAIEAIEAGIAAVTREYERGLHLVGTGDMGIGNTTPSSAICAVLTKADIASVTGRGTGIDEATRRHKVAVIERALAVNKPDPADPLDVLAKVGGFEIGAIAGIILGAAAHHIPVLVDGFISTAGAMIAAALAPTSRGYMIAAHRSVEPGHRLMQDYLDLQPIFQLDLRLGEGTGAALAMPVVVAAVAILNQMATFTSANVSQKG